MTAALLGAKHLHSCLSSCWKLLFIGKCGQKMFSATTTGVSGPGNLGKRSMVKKKKSKHTHALTSTTDRDLSVFVSMHGSAHKFPGSGESKNKPEGRGCSPTQTPAGRIFPLTCLKCIISLYDINMIPKTEGSPECTHTHPHFSYKSILQNSPE